MDIFNSEWLIKMLEKSSKKPQDRILNLFDILDDWLKAPKIAVSHGDNYMPLEAQHGIKRDASKQLIEFCVIQVKACGAEDPDILAKHIVLIARNALYQATYETDSLLQAKKVAKALITSQTQNNRGVTPSIQWLKASNYAIAAGVVLTTILASFWLTELTLISASPIKLVSNHPTQAKIASIQKVNNQLTAFDAAKMYAKFEEMRHGTCQFPEALQIPDKDKVIYLENVVGGKLPENVEDLAIANKYLEKVRCNFTPILMAHST